MTIFEDNIIKTSFGWCFFYNSYEYVMYNNDGKKMFSSPVLVDKDLNLAFRTGTRLSAEEYIEIYEECRGDLKTFYRLALQP